MALVTLMLRTHDSTTSPYAISGLLACFALPLVLTMGLVGSVADRADSRTVLLVGSLVQAAAAAALAFTHDYATTLALVALLQTAFAFTTPVWASLLPLVAGTAHTGALVSLRQGLRTAADPVGAALGGVLVQHHGADQALLADAASFLALTLAALTVRVRRRRAAEPTPLSLSPGPAVAILRRHATVGVLLAAVLPFILAIEAVNAVEVYVLRDVLHASPADYGWAEAAAGASATLGVLLAGVVRSTDRRAQVMLTSLLGVLNALLFAILLTEIPGEQQGRVLAAVEGAARSCTLVALTLGGTLNLVFGPQGSYLVIGAVGLTIGTLGTLGYRRVRTRAA
ncbi:MFS transporter [Arsenicicoccus sp. oral taxon 190]|uniref:MFS transporter n=1 Tax=Arsenicicoccus sp. oral taxon 190 TaxID=1658671 RepID=UPI000679F3BC|nr:MFS transporter [Arsenicicoccus sp. oral taxon 190]AKT50632.1 hypothetical protein ADJ73_03695 [Arsenicicoccus sp. oral taxon 190]